MGYPPAFKIYCGYFVQVKKGSSILETRNHIPEELEVIVLILYEIKVITHTHVALSDPERYIIGPTFV